MSNASGGTNIQNLNQEILSKHRVQLSSLPTQQKIASILSAYDDLIQNYKKQIEALQTAASELYKEWFVRFRFPG
ncbi:MAG: restriction endonuclease subunit S [Treponema sp.]|nr:restriction endonuclease subunit S [Treponema sp.]